MSPFTHPEITRDRAIYDLHAVCSHYGYMNFGHYIAFCKPYSEEELGAVALTNTDGKLFSHCYVLCTSERINVSQDGFTTLFQALFRAILAASSTGRAAPREGHTIKFCGACRLF